MEFDQGRVSHEITALLLLDTIFDDAGETETVNLEIGNLSVSLILLIPALDRRVFFVADIFAAQQLRPEMTDPSFYMVPSYYRGSQFSSGGNPQERLLAPCLLVPTYPDATMIQNTFAPSLFLG